MREVRLFVPAVVMWPMPPAVVAMPAMIRAITVVMLVYWAVMMPAVMMITRLGISGG